MSSAKTTERFACTPHQFYELITDFSSYPKFLNEVKECRVVGEKAGKKVVEYQVSFIKNFTYRLLMSFEPDRRLSWTLDSGDLFKESRGSWDLKEVDGQTEATYEVEAKFKVFVPGPVAKTLVNVSLPNMMAAYRKRVAELYGK